ncbi:MAG: hypothetical protein EBX35_13430 [Planctomycetia bacterium]|nr:hypothetical protein [Planctomycetia bacterium]
MSVAELMPVPPAATVMFASPFARVTAPSDSVDVAWARPVKLRNPPRSVIGAASLTRSARSYWLALLMVSVPALRSMPLVPERRPPS